jgi:hypothetical protein
MYEKSTFFASIQNFVHKSRVKIVENNNNNNSSVKIVDNLLNNLPE